MFTVTSINSTTIKASWQLSSGESERGIIKGFKLFFKTKDVIGLPTMLTINGSATHTYYATGLDKDTEYEFQLLAFSLAGDGPKSSVKALKTMDNGKDSYCSCIPLSPLIVIHQARIQDFEMGGEFL